MIKVNVIKGNKLFTENFVKYSSLIDYLASYLKISKNDVPEIALNIWELNVGAGYEYNDYIFCCAGKNRDHGKEDKL